MIRSNGYTTTLVCDHQGCTQTLRLTGAMRLAKAVAELRGWACRSGHFCYLHKRVVL